MRKKCVGAIWIKLYSAFFICKGRGQRMAKKATKVTEVTEATKVSKKRTKETKKAANVKVEPQAKAQAQTKKVDVAAESKHKKMGRKEKEINKRQFEKLCEIQCTEEEVCSVLGVTDKTLARWCKNTYNKRFSEVFREKRLGGKASLRRNQWHMAETNPTMAIWLGKQYLGQKDKWDEDDNKEILEKLDNVLQKMDGVI